VHELRIHGYPKRRVRNPDSGENESIKVVAIRCEAARRQGKAYTRRVLPEFLIPHCVIRLDRVEQAVALPAGERTAERVCEMLGCIDARTAGRHLKGFTQAADRASLWLAERRSQSPELGDLPSEPPDSSVPARFEQLYRAELEATERAGGEAKGLPSVRQLLQAAMRKAARKSPSSCVSGCARPP
jgi:hypothetical protein